MVENHSHCVLQWSGHAGYVAERFSGLLASQALVDVTLICEEQKLRVHKLVLASNSTYFEEILQQDLGQDPIILLRDLNFEILKAMVEFMYCGETTISHENLPSLLTASKVFKVNKLAYIIDTIMETEHYNSDIKSITQIQETDKNLNHKNNNCKNYCCPRMKDNTEIISNVPSFENNTIDTTAMKYEFEEGNRSIHNSNNTFKHRLYEDPLDTEGSVQCVTDPLLTENSKENLQDEPCNTSMNDKSKETLETPAKSNVKTNDIYKKTKEVQPLLYDQCCDVLDINLSEQYSPSLPQICAQDIKLDAAQNVVDNASPTKVQKCIKVYTHKKRKPAINIRNELTRISNIVPKSSSSTDSIDLLDVPSGNGIPVTLLTPLDMECAEYLFSLDNENMQSVAESLMNEQRSLMKCTDINECINGKTCNDSTLDIHENNVNKNNNADPQTINNKVHEMERPVLRRSVRLNQQESEDSTNTSISIQEPVLTEKLFEKSNYPSKADSFTKSKRKIKETNRKGPDQNVINVARFNKKCFNNLRTHRNTSKNVVKKNIKSACAGSNKEKGDQKAKSNNRVKCEMRENIDTLKISMGSPLRQNTIGYISRALWGDMSDIIEHNNDIMDLAEYSPNGEIPFAVGLLPLRTALEKMQAMPDYQPRKTRSSVAPIKQEINYLKRKNCSLEPTVFAKKQNVGTIVQNDKTNTVCHIQIRTTPSQYIKSRKKFLTEHVTNLGSGTIINRQ